MRKIEKSTDWKKWKPRLGSPLSLQTIAPRQIILGWSNIFQSCQVWLLPYLCFFLLLTYAAIFLCEYKSTVQLQGLHRKACHMSLRSGRQAAPTNEIVVHGIFPTTFLSSDGLASQMWVPHWKRSDQVMYDGATLRISYLSKGQWLEFDTGRKDGRIIWTCLWSREFQVGPNFMQDANSMKGLLSNSVPLWVPNK